MIVEEETRGATAPEPDAAPAEAPIEPDSVGATLTRIDRTLREIRGVLDAQTRERQHREFSATQLIGAVLQVVVLGLLVLALLDWVFQSGVTRVNVKLAFATVLQIMALTAFAAGRQKH